MSEVPTSTSRLQVRPRHCDAQGMVHAARYYEYFEDAFLDWLDRHAGGYRRLRSAGVDVVIVASGCEYRDGAHLDDLLFIETRPVAAGTSSLSVTFTVRRDEQVLAVGRATYVCVSDGSAVRMPAVLGDLLRNVPPKSEDRS
ncbi:acyl-CoA thioesterase [Actinomadura sp. HBU206391]|uniref:acyl-CoA thioesterase n=1 Tax=Actinomadura sp. HBU206391 TaxID=2731692 RepID=UPI00164FF2F6|nr:thioesterase family protein [Actinomadura sp. HBU206391]MBC6457189.1 acyl-CoA thioesterase [Actinomadura sp. HBU206391]